MPEEKNYHIISILMENEAGALSRVVNLFSARGYNIESLCVATTEDESVSRLTLTSCASSAIIEQILKQLNKLIDTIKVVDVTEGNHVERELMLLKLKADTPDLRAEITRLIDVFRGRVLDISDVQYIVEITGTRAKLDAFIAAVNVDNIRELARSGVSGMMRGIQTLK